MLIGLYLSGLLLAFTPCMLPMLPILASILVATDGPITGHRAFLLSLVFVLGSSLCYALLGVASGYIGAYIPSMVHTPLLVVPVSCLLILMALMQVDLVRFPSMFNFIPAVRRDSILGSFLLGSLSTVAMSPCVTPVLVGVLVYIGTTGDMLLGGLMLFVLGLGIGTPLLALSLMGHKVLPKPGKWMTYIKYLSAITLILLASFMTYNVYASEQSPPANKLKHQQVIEKKVLIFVTSPSCSLCVSVEEAIQQGAAKGWEVHRVRSYPGAYGTPNLIKVVNGHETGRLGGGPRSYDEVRSFLNA